MTARLKPIAFLMMAACTHDPRSTSAKADRPTTLRAHQTPTGSGSIGGSLAVVPIITNRAEAGAAIGKRVRVQGTAERTKLGDAVSSESFSVVCLEPRFPDLRIDQPIVVEGMLELTDEFQATQGSDGLISQGTMPGTSTYIIQVCTVH